MSDIFSHFKKLLQLNKPKDCIVIPEQFHDPLALRIAWSPLQPGGTNFRNRKAFLHENNATILEFKRTYSYTLFLYVIILFFGICTYLFYQDVNKSGMEYIFLLVFGGVVIIGLSLFFEDYNKRIIFDKSIEVFHPAWEEIDEHNSNQDTIPLKSIHALQIIPEYIRNTKSRYYSYELNLVLRDGRRINVLDYGNLERVLEDAQILSEFLSVPVWDATKHCLQSEETQT